MPDKYIWDKESGPEFQTTLASIPFQDKIKSFLNQNPSYIWQEASVFAQAAV
jgi:hypothetical protein